MVRLEYKNSHHFHTWAYIKDIHIYIRTDVPKCHQEEIKDTKTKQEHTKTVVCTLTGELNDVPLTMRRRLWFQYDEAPVHNAKQVIAYLDRDFWDQWIGRSGAVELLQGLLIYMRRFVYLGKLQGHCVRNRMCFVYYFFNSTIKKLYYTFLTCVLALSLSFYLLLMTCPKMYFYVNMVPINVFFLPFKLLRGVLKHILQ